MIDVTGPISLDADPLAIDLDGGSSLTIAGIDGTGSAQAETLGDGREAGLVFSAGSVTVENLTIANAVVQGGTLVLDAGATASGTVIHPGGTFDLQAGGALSGSVAFAGGGTLQIDGTTMTAATISGFGTGGRIDLTGTPSTLPAARS